MNNEIVKIPPLGIQETHIGISSRGNVSELYNFSKNLYGQFDNLGGAGTSKTKNVALKLAKYESMERLANTINCRHSVIELGTNLKYQTVNMNIFPPSDNSELNYSENTALNWVETYDYFNHSQKYIPQSYIYLYNEKPTWGDQVTSPISTGAALHDNYESAILNGIYEVVERDSISLTWLLKSINSDVTHLFKKNNKIFNNKFLGTVRFYDVSTVPGIITICAHARANHSKKCKNVLMFCSSINFEDIEQKLTKELISVMFTFANSKKTYDLNTDYHDFMSVDQSGYFMSFDFNDKYFNFFKHVPKKLKPYPIKKNINKTEELKEVLNILKSQNFSLYITDISNREVLDNHYKAVKVVIPEAQPISFIYKNRYLYSNRLIKLAKKKYGHNYFSKLNHMPLAFS